MQSKDGDGMEKKDGPRSSSAASESRFVVVVDADEVGLAAPLSLLAWG